MIDVLHVSKMIKQLDERENQHLDDLIDLLNKKIEENG
jgi:hypothetical protein